jgi:VanZ family protein
MDMSLRANQVNVFRIALVFVLMAILILAMLPNQSLGMDKLNDKLNHIVAFFTCALLVDFSFPETEFGFKKIIALLGYGLLIEIIQWFLVYRSSSLFDLAADAIGLLCYGLSLPLIKQLPIFKRRWVVDHG